MLQKRVTGDTVEERVPWIGQKLEQEAIGFACAGGQEQLIGMDLGAFSGKKACKGFPSPLGSKRLRFIGKGSGSG
jgi:hypothetical protein